jgi:hypothetical protein
MRMQIDEAGRNDETAGVEDLRVSGSEPAGSGDFRDFLAIEQNVERRIRVRRGIHDAAVLNEEHAKGP